MYVQAARVSPRAWLILLICIGTTYPLDLVRSRLSIATAFGSGPPPPPKPPSGLTAVKQTLSSAYHTSSNHQPTTMWGMTLKVMREEGGVRALYRGLVSSRPTCAAYISNVGSKRWPPRLA